MSKEVITLLKKALKIKDRISLDYSEHTIKLAFDEVMVFIEDALAVERSYPVDGKTYNPDPLPDHEYPSKQSTAGEWTKEKRRYFTLLPEEECETLVLKVTRHCSLVIHEACDRLDRAEAENKSLNYQLECTKNHYKRSKEYAARYINMLMECFNFDEGEKANLSALAGAETVRKKINQLKVKFDRAEAELEAKDKLLFAYESVNAPVNPLIAINKELLEACGPFARLADMIPNIHAPDHQWEKFWTAIRALPLDRYREARAAIAKQRKSSSHKN